jgi:hypothetical protein
LQDLRHARSSQRAGKRRILNIPTPNFSDILPKVDCWRRDWKIGGEGNEVSDAVSCSVGHIKERIWLVWARSSDSICFTPDLCMFHAYLKEMDDL